MSPLGNSGLFFVILTAQIYNAQMTACRMAMLIIEQYHSGCRDAFFPAFKPQLLGGSSLH
jgi:hypothetical protein